MKRVLLPVLILLAAACKGRHEHRPIASGIVLRAAFTDSNTTTQQEEATRAALQQRLDKTIPDSAEVRLTAHQLEIRIAGDAFNRLNQKSGNGNIHSLIVASGDFGILELYGLDKLSAPLTTMQERSVQQKATADNHSESLSRYKDQTLFANLASNNDGRQGYIGMASDTILVNRIFQQVHAAELLPGGVRLLWDMQPKEGYFTLWPARIPPASCRIDGTMIDTAYLEPDPTNGKSELHVKIKQPYIANWTRLTQRNAGYQLPVVVAGKVVSCPRVIDAITGGDLAITGMEDRELKEVLELVQLRPLPARIVIISEDVFPKQ